MYTQLFRNRFTVYTILIHHKLQAANGMSVYVKSYLHMPLYTGILTVTSSQKLTVEIIRTLGENPNLWGLVKRFKMSLFVAIFTQNLSSCPF